MRKANLDAGRGDVPRPPLINLSLELPSPPPRVPAQHPEVILRGGVPGLWCIGLEFRVVPPGVHPAYLLGLILQNVSNEWF